MKYRDWRYLYHHMMAEYRAQKVSNLLGKAAKSYIKADQIDQAEVCSKLLGLAVKEGWV